MDKNIIKSTQEQAIAAWIDYLNHDRIQNLMDFLSQQDLNLENAMEELTQTFDEISGILSSNRGGTRGIHGFLAEVAEKGIENARRNINGEQDITSWINDNGPSDLLRNGINIQQKFYQADLSLGAVAEHLSKYPDFVKKGGKYMIPADQYRKIREYLEIPEAAANKIGTSDGSFSLKQWKMIHGFFEENGITPEDIEPASFEYREVQKGNIYETLEKEKDDLIKSDNKRRVSAMKNNAPSLAEGVKVTTVSALAEGGTAFTMAIIGKIKSGKSIKAFTEDDWKEVFGDAGKGAAKGGIRGASVYGISNLTTFLMNNGSGDYASVTTTPTAVANALVTASFGVADQVHKYRIGELTKTQVIQNSEILCMDSAVSAVSSVLGQTLIPIPVIGAVIGNAVGSAVYKCAKDYLNDSEQSIIEEYIREIDKTKDALDTKYHVFIETLKQDIDVYFEILTRLYSVDISQAFDASIDMAVNLGLSEQEILKNQDEIADYFLN